LTSMRRGTFQNTMREEIEALRRLVQNPLQTNDVGRSGSLLGGFALIAENTGLPLRLLKLGSRFLLGPFPASLVQGTPTGEKNYITVLFGQASAQAVAALL
jgi:hypothetical protein